jgi:hypothetical protein
MDSNSTEIYLKLPRAEVIVRLGEIDVVQELVEGQSSSPWIVQAQQPICQHLVEDARIRLDLLHSLVIGV